MSGSSATKATPDRMLGDGVLARRARRVAMGDVDAARVLYVATPFRWAEELFTGWLFDVGRPISRLLEQRSSCPTVATTAKYLRPLRLDDLVELELVAERLGETSFVVRMDAYAADGGLAVQVSTRHVWVELAPDDDPKPAVPPDWLRSVFPSTK